MNLISVFNMMMFLQAEKFIRSLFILVSKTPPITEVSIEKTIQANVPTSPSSPPPNASQRLPSAIEIQDYPLEHFSRSCNIAIRQLLVKNPENILPFELSYSSDYPQEISNKKWDMKLQERLNWIRHSLSANGESDYSWIMLSRYDNSKRTQGYAYMKMSAKEYLETAPCIHKTYSVPPLTPEILEAGFEPPNTQKKKSKKKLNEAIERRSRFKEKMLSRHASLMKQDKRLTFLEK